VLSEFVALVAPPRCALCANECRVRQQVCDACEAALHRLPARPAAIPGLALVWSAVPYEGRGRALVGALKFGARLPLAKLAAATIAARAPSELLDGTLVPVPAAPWRRRWRGFDPAEAIARALAAEAGLGLRQCLRRSQGMRQVGRPRAQRLADPPRVRATGPVPSRAILVDDVVTTGATLQACSRALRGQGALRIVALTFARSGAGVGVTGGRD